MSSEPKFMLYANTLQHKMNIHYSKLVFIHTHIYMYRTFFIYTYESFLIGKVFLIIILNFNRHKCIIQGEQKREKGLILVESLLVFCLEYCYSESSQI